MNDIPRHVTWRRATVERIVPGWTGVQRLDCTLVEGDDHTPIRALAYSSLVGEARVGDSVLLNVNALVRHLGTGGFAFVVAIEGRVPSDPLPGPGHLVKARYTPLQAIVLGVDEQEAAYHHALEEADSIDGMPVVVADLHSSLPAIVIGARAAAAKAGRRQPTIAYLMTDGGALPAAFSATVATLRDLDWLAACISVGQTFGGDLEAVSVHSGLLAARLVVKADLAIVIQGPGNLGTGTRWGFSGVAVGDHVNAAATLDGRPIGVLRVSGADRRVRHQGISHHSITAYGRVALRPADIVMPVFTGELADLGDSVKAQVARVVEPQGIHRLVEVETEGLLGDLQQAPIRLNTMGRTLAHDPAAFLTAAAAGVHAVELLG